VRSGRAALDLRPAARNAPADFEHRDVSAETRGVESEFARELVERARRIERAEDRALRIGQAGVAHSVRFRLGARSVGRGRRAGLTISEQSRRRVAVRVRAVVQVACGCLERLKDVIRVGDHLSAALLDKGERALGGGGIDACGEGEDLAAVVLSGQAGGDERPGSVAGLDDKHPEGEPGDDAVSGREVVGVRSGAEGQFGDDGARVGGDAVEEFPVVGRVALGEAAAEDGDGSAAGLDRSFMGCGIDSSGTAGDDRQAGPGQMRGEAVGLLAPVLRAGSRADDGDRVVVGLGGLEAAADVEDWRRVGRLGEEWGVFGGADRHEVDAERFGKGEFFICEAVGIRDGRGGLAGEHVADAFDAFEVGGSGGENGLDAAECLDCALDEDGAEPGDERQAEKTADVGCGGRHLFGAYRKGVEVSRCQGVEWPILRHLDRPVVGHFTGRMTQEEIDWLALEVAYQQALKSKSEGGIPIGSALLNPDGVVVALGHNLRVQRGDPTAHAETVCIRNAGRRRDWNTLTLASTLSPCAMCSGTAVLHRIPRVIIGENQTFLGREDWLKAAGMQVRVLEDERCIGLMREFIAAHPELWNEDIGVPPGKN